MCVRPLNGRHRRLKPLVFLRSWAPFLIFFFFHYEAVMQHALQKVLSKRLGAGAEFVKKAELSGQTHVTHSHQTRTVQQDQIAKSLSPHAPKSPYPSPNVKISAGEKPHLFERKCHVVNSVYLFLFFLYNAARNLTFVHHQSLASFLNEEGGLRKQQNLRARTTNRRSGYGPSVPFSSRLRLAEGQGTIHVFSLLAIQLTRSLFNKNK